MQQSLSETQRYIMYSYNQSLPPKQLGGQGPNFKKIEKVKDIVETVQHPF